MQTTSQTQLKKANNTKRSLLQRFQAMNSEQKKLFFENIENQTGRSNRTVYRWVEGKSLPSLAEQKIIADYLDLKVSSVFPLNP